MLAKKMRIHPGTVITTVNAPVEYSEILGPLPEGVTIRQKPQKTNAFIHLFVHNQAELEARFFDLVASLEPGGLLCISYPKGSSGLQTDLTRDKGWNCLKQVKLEWLGLISFDATWSVFMLRNAPPRKQSRASKDYHANQKAIADPKTKTVIVPDDLKAALARSTQAREVFEALSFSNRKEYVMWIVSAKRGETRNERVRKTLEKLMQGKRNPMEK